MLCQIILYVSECRWIQAIEIWLFTIMLILACTDNVSNTYGLKKTETKRRTEKSQLKLTLPARLWGKKASKPWHPREK